MCMYGLVNKVIKDAIFQRYGETAWQAICKRIKLEDDIFVNLEPYPDELTHRMVAEAASYTGQSIPDMLMEFGRHWIEYNAVHGYGDMLKLAGKDLYTFLSNLDHMHAGMSHVFPELRPPSFRCERLGENQLKLYYRSERQGLQAFVVGMVQGLGEYFDTPLEVKHTGPCEKESICEEFIIDIKV